MTGPDAGVAHVRMAAPEHRPAAAIGWAVGAIGTALAALDRGDLDDVRAALLEAAAVLDSDLVYGDASGDAR